MTPEKYTITDLNGNPLQMAPGCRFAPQDQDLVVSYLRRKENALPMRANMIPQIPDVFHCPPWELPSRANEEKRFFFSPRTKNSSCIVNTGEDRRCGYWKHNVDEDRRIVARGTNSVVGIKKTWVFYTEDSFETHWIMHQFSLVPDASLTMEKVVEVGEWNVYRIYQREEECNDGNWLLYSSSSSESSDESSGELDQEANSGETDS